CTAGMAFSILAGFKVRQLQTSYVAAVPRRYSMRADLILRTHSYALSGRSGRLRSFRLACHQADKRLTETRNFPFGGGLPDRNAQCALVRSKSHRLEDMAGTHPSG